MEPEAEIWRVEEWLEKIGMSKYAEGFVDNGYETVELVTQMKAEDMDAVGVTNKQHRGILFTQANLLLEEVTGVVRPSPPPSKTKPASVITLSISGSVSPTTPPSSATGGYTEPWDNTTLSPSPAQSPLASTLTETAGYSEPWNSAALSAPKTNGPSKVHTDSVDGGKVPPPLPPPNKAGKGKAKKPPPSPGINLPEFKRVNGEKGLTKLQLKLKIRDELQKDAIILSEPPYCQEDGSQNDEALVELASTYADRFGVESLGVYDALTEVWRHNNNKSEFVTPSPATPALHGGPSDNYDEPFDSQAVPPSTGKRVSGEVTTPKDKSAPKSQTLPSTNQSNYDEPFDSVKSPDESPERIRSSKVELSKTLPSPKIQKKDAAPEATKEIPPTSKRIGRFFRRDREKKSRSHSLKNDASSKPEEEDGKKGKKQALISFPEKSKKSTKNKKHLSSVDNLKVAGEGERMDKSPKARRGAGKSVRASVAGYPTQNGFSHEPPKRRSSLDTSPSESEESPQQRKKHGGKLFQKFITPPTLKRNQSPDYSLSSGSDDDKTPPSLRRLKQLGNMTGSDLEINTHVQDEDSKGWMVTSRSFDNLAEVEQKEKKTKKIGLFRRLLTFRKTVTMPAHGNRKKGKGKSRDIDTVVNSLSPNRESSLTSSVSMPDMAALKIMEPPSPVPEAPLSTVPNQPRPIKHSPAMSLLRKDSPSPIHRGNISSPPEKPQVMISSAPAETSYLSSGSVPKDDSTIPMVRTGSAGSSRSPGLFSKPPPPPKPSTLTRKSTSARTSQESSESSKLDTENKSKSVPLAKSVNESNSSSVAKAPAKPRRSIKRGGVTEQRRQELKDSDNASQTNDSSPIHQNSPEHTKRASGLSQDSSQRNSSPEHTKRASGLSQDSSQRNSSPEHTKRASGLSQDFSQRNSSSEHTKRASGLSQDSPQRNPTQSLPSSTREHPVSTPPPKPSRNYKSVKILSPPPDKTAPPLDKTSPLPNKFNTVSLPEKTTPASVAVSGGQSSENVKPSELFRRGHSTSTESPSPTPRGDKGSEVQGRHPVPKPRTNVDVDSKTERPHPPNKPQKSGVLRS